MKTFKIAAVALTSVFITGAASAATELISNGGFENGDLSGWSCTGAAQCRERTTSPHTGRYHMQGFDNVGFATLSQTVATIAGTAYDFSFWSFASNLSQGNILRYSLDGGSAVTVTTTTSYAQSIDNFIASGSSAVISFFFETNPGTGSWRIDDVSVTGAGISPVPVPAGGLLLTSALVGGGWVSRRKKKPS